MITSESPINEIFVSIYATSNEITSKTRIIFVVQLCSRQLKKYLFVPRQNDLISPRKVAELEVYMIPRIRDYFEVLMKGYIFLKLHNEALNDQVESITESKATLYRFRFRSKNLIMSYNTWILEKEMADYIYLAMKEQAIRQGWMDGVIQ